MPVEPTIQSLATRFLRQFVAVPRNSDTTDDIDSVAKWTIEANAPDYDDIVKLIHKAHEDLFPDDYKYLFVCQVLLAIADCSTRELMNNKRILEHMPEQVENYWLCQWLQSNLLRFGYCDEIIQNKRRMRGINHIGELLMLAYRDEQLYTIQKVKRQLYAMLDEY